MNAEIKAIALYLPQFHPIPENDLWWGKGFTEWTNVTKAKALFKNHWQPRLPADLGFYDLRVPEVREAQASMAKNYGIHGFCYWHYWFGGKRIIERPFNEVVSSGNPDFPFCVAWANQSWQGTWHGLSNKQVLIEQTYPGSADYEKHFYALLHAFRDARYIEVNGRKLVFVFRPMDIPEPKLFIEIWQNLAVKEGFKGIHFVGMHMDENWIPEKYGYDAMVQNWINRNKFKKYSLKDKLEHRLINHKFLLSHTKRKVPTIVDYGKYVENYPEHTLKVNEYPMVYPDWDNTPRMGAEGWLFEGSTADLFGKLCMRAFKETLNKRKDEKIVIIKSWNEWAEGNYLEPDKENGTTYLEEFQKQVVEFSMTNHFRHH